MRFNPLWILLLFLLMPWFLAPLMVLVLLMFLGAVLLSLGAFSGGRLFSKSLMDDLWNLFVSGKRRADFALFHATVNILSACGAQLDGRGDSDGFVLWGEVDSAQVYEAALQALARLKGGERELAVCGSCRTFRALGGLLVALLLALFLAPAGGWSVVLAPIAGYFSASAVSPFVQRLFLFRAPVEELAVQGVSVERSAVSPLFGGLSLIAEVKVTTSRLASVIEAEILQE
ncbi:MAG: DUF6391 domain-containing protein [Pyramidobacter sp.]|jgi:hypothetical protein